MNPTIPNPTRAGSASSFPTAWYAARDNHQWQVVLHPLSCSYSEGDDSQDFYVLSGVCPKSVLGGLDLRTCSVSPVFLKRFLTDD